jgi:hypothetical protein
MSCLSIYLPFYWQISVREGLSHGTQDVDRCEVSGVEQLLAEAQPLRNDLGWVLLLFSSRLPKP